MGALLNKNTDGILSAFCYDFVNYYSFTMQKKKN